MVKRKHESAASGAHSDEIELDNSSNEQQEQQQQLATGTNRKRPRAAALNFSIESIMKPHHNQLASSHSHNIQIITQTNQVDDGRTSASSRSSASPIIFSHEDGRSSASLASSSSSASRASTPISPGCTELGASNATDSNLAKFQHHRNGMNFTHRHRHQHQQRQRSKSDSDSDSDDLGETHVKHEVQSQLPVPVPTSLGDTRPGVAATVEFRTSTSPKHATNQQQSASSTASSRQQHQKHAATATSAPASCSAYSRLNQVECVLDNKEMWDKFHSLNTEMIITKTGRRMFPVMKVQFHNLDPNARYAVSMDIVPVDNKRYRYAYHKSCWQVAGKADPSAEPRLYAHPDSPFSGDLLSRQVISFEKVKLTNNEADKSGHIILNSMHKYQPRVHLIELKQTPPPPPLAPVSGPAAGKTSAYGHATNQARHHQHQAPQLDIEGYRTFVFSETVFTAVTAYQNQLITKMKIDKNPFAKGFRDSSRLSDLDRGDPFDYMGPLGPTGCAGSSAGLGRSGFGPHPPLGAPGSLEAAAAAAAAAAGLPGNPMDAYQALLASAAATQNPWYSAAMAAASAGPFGQSAAACSTAQAAQQIQAQMWLATLSACLGGGGGGAGPQNTPLSGAGLNPFGHSTPNGGAATPNSCSMPGPFQVPPGGVSPNEKLASLRNAAGSADSHTGKGHATHTTHTSNNINQNLNQMGRESR